jgi:cyclase
MPLTVGGGINALEGHRKLLRARSEKVSISTGAVARSNLSARRRALSAANCVVVAIGAKRAESWEVFTHGEEAHRDRRL